MWTWNNETNDGHAVLEKEYRYGYIAEYAGPFSNPIPEPASIAVWALLAIVGLGFGFRRRRRN